MVITAASITALSRALAPVINDIYKSAKGKVATELSNWSSTLQAKNIISTLSKIENVRTLWSREKDLSIYSFYYPSKLVIDTSRKEINSIKDLPEGNIIIQGIVGQGKSIFMRYMAAQAIRDKEPQIPIFVELRSLTKNSNLTATVYRILESIGVNISDASFDHLALSGKLLLVLDGFDEIENELTKEVLTEIEDISIKHSKIKIIVSSRPNNEIQKLSNFLIVDIASLRSSDYESFLYKLSLSTVKANEIINAIKESPADISNLISTPLMMTLVVMVYESEKEIPPVLSDFFERLFFVVFSRHDRQKPGFERTHHSGLSEIKLQLLFESFCFICIKNGYGRTLSREQFYTAFEEAIKYTIECDCEAEKFKMDITKVACLMLEEGIDLSTFLHKSILEYYAASFVKRATQDFAIKFYDHIINNLSLEWMDVLVFLKDIDTYRFSKFYALIILESVQSKIGLTLETKNITLLYNYIDEILPNLQTSLAREDGQHWIRSTGSDGGVHDFFIEKLCEEIIIGTHNMLPKNIKFENFSELESDFAGLFEKNEDIIKIRYRALIQYYGDKELWQIFENFYEHLKREIEHTKSTIGKHEKLLLMKF